MFQTQFAKKKSVFKEKQNTQHKKTTKNTSGATWLQKNTSIRAHLDKIGDQSLQETWMAKLPIFTQEPVSSRVCNI